MIAKPISRRSARSVVGHAAKPPTQGHEETRVLVQAVYTGSEAPRWPAKAVGPARKTYAMRRSLVVLSRYGLARPARAKNPT